MAELALPLGFVYRSSEVYLWEARVLAGYFFVPIIRAVGVVRVPSAQWRDPINEKDQQVVALLLVASSRKKHPCCEGEYQ